jgi:V8-like Glu-specific endopeptidase
LTRTRTIVRVTSFILVWAVSFGAYLTYHIYTADEHWDQGSPAVGALFVGTGFLVLKHPFCTATVVASPKGNMVVTAAHCIAVPVRDIRFAPYYHNGVEPFGTFTVTSVTEMQAWTQHGSPNADVAFLTVNGDVQRLAGADQIGSSSPPPARVTVDGYSFPNGETVNTGRVTTIIVQGQRQLRFDCPGYTAGASGAPFLTSAGTIVGVLGGYQNGGVSSSVSYASPFGPAVKALYHRAEKQHG